MNRWIFTGNLGGDAELRFTNKGIPVAGFNVAVVSGYGENKATTWARCSLWGKRAESLAPYLNKGTLVAVSGEVTLREYESKGSKGTSLDVRVDELTLLGGRQVQSSGPRQDQQAPQQAEIQQEDFKDDDLPF